jgi:hypothetical protein
VPAALRRATVQQCHFSRVQYATRSMEQASAHSSQQLTIMHCPAAGGSAEPSKQSKQASRPEQIKQQCLWCRCADDDGCVVLQVNQWSQQQHQPSKAWPPYAHGIVYAGQPSQVAPPQVSFTTCSFANSCRASLVADLP